MDHRPIGYWCRNFHRSDILRNTTRVTRLANSRRSWPGGFSCVTPISSNIQNDVHPIAGDGDTSPCQLSELMQHGMLVGSITPATVEKLIKGCSDLHGSPIFVDIQTSHIRKSHCRSARVGIRPARTNMPTDRSRRLRSKILRLHLSRKHQ